MRVRDTIVSSKTKTTTNKRTATTIINCYLQRQNEQANKQTITFVAATSTAAIVIYCY